MAADPTLYFLSHMRRGIGQHRTAAGEVDVAVRLEASARSEDIAISLPVAGPEHVTGISPAEVVRTVPADASQDLEPNVFPAVEFSLPDLPWLFSPQAGDSPEQVNPWIVLVVVEKAPGAALQTLPGREPVLQIRAPQSTATVLPDLAESWAWAHVQCRADLSTQSPEDALAHTPELFRSRLICPRRLKPLTDYIACVVPATLGGLQAGLGLTVGDTPHAPAWTGGESEIDLPVYFHWQFRTAARGDFEHLVSKLKPRELETGTVLLDLSDPGDARLPAGARYGVTFRGALVGTSAKVRPWDGDHQTAYVSGMAKILAAHQPGKPIQKSGRYDALRDDPVVAPPLWGAYRNGAEKAPAPPARKAPEDAAWFTGVNYDPALRAAAGLGAEAVRQNQEELMAEAWRQVDGLRAVNRVLNETRLAAETSLALKTGKIDPLSNAETAALAAPSKWRRMALDGSADLTLQVAASPAPDALTSPDMARIARRSGPIGKRGKLPEPIVAEELDFFTKRPELALNFADFRTPVGTADDNLVSSLGAPGLPEQKQEPARKAPVAKRKTPALGTDAPVKTRRRAAPATRHPRGGDAAARKAAIAPMKTALAQTPKLLDPIPVLSARVDARVTLPNRDSLAQPIPPLQLVEPRFDISGYTMLRAISPDAVMPGVKSLPINSVGLAQVNAAFVESWLLGANAEMSREMLWREYPGRLSGTFFRRFWDSAGASDDIGAIADWKQARLGQHQIGPGQDGTLVLLVKGEVLRRYPDLRIYASRARWDDRGFRYELREKGRPEKAKQPLFGGWLNRATAFFAFDLSLQQARGTLQMMGPEPGWFFVFEQPQDGIQFGMDVPPANGRARAPKRWEQLHWAHALEDPGGNGDVSHVSLARGVGAQTLPIALDRPQETWGRSASAQARITLQRPMRVLFHASAMLP